MREGLTVLPAFLDDTQQARLVAWTRELCTVAPLAQPTMPDGQPLSVRVTNCGRAGWWADRAGGYRYTLRHPVTGNRWPPAPPWVLALAVQALCRAGLAPVAFDCVAVNYYAPGAKLGAHIDRSEVDTTVPIVSFSLGATALFEMGGPHRDDPRERHTLASGDACVMAPPARNWFHAVVRVYEDPLLVSPTRTGRINLTVRKVL